MINNFYNFIKSNKVYYSQLHQDLFVSYFYQDLGPGFFVEFGALDGVQFSNTLLLEKSLKWNGILVEPIPKLYKKIKNNRSCYIDNSCIFSESDKEIDFFETEFSAVSTISKYAYEGDWADFRKNEKYKIYKVKTLTLKDLLKKYNAPVIVDYLSIDAEGSEYDILKAFDFSTTFNIITCEHNNSPNKEKINNLLLDYGYEQVFKDFTIYESWYLHKNFKNKFNKSKFT